MTQDQKKAFAEALLAARDLMGKLYQIRYMFPHGSDVWYHIPAAQTALTRVQKSIEDAIASEEIKEESDGT